MIINFCIIDLFMELVGREYVLGGQKDHVKITEYLKLFYQTIDASFNYVLLKIIM